MHHNNSIKKCLLNNSFHFLLFVYDTYTSKLFRYLLKNSEWLKEELGDMDDDYILFDCPGQIELYTHMNTMKELVDLLEKWGFRMCAVFLMDAQFMVDGAKFISGTAP